MPGSVEGKSRCRQKQSATTHAFALEDVGGAICPANPGKAPNKRKTGSPENFNRFSGAKTKMPHQHCQVRQERRLNELYVQVLARRVKSEGGGAGLGFQQPDALVLEGSGFEEFHRILKSLNPVDVKAHDVYPLSGGHFLEKAQVSF